MGRDTMSFNIKKGIRTRYSGHETKVIVFKCHIDAFHQQARYLYNITKKMKKIQHVCHFPFLSNLGIIQVEM